MSRELIKIVGHSIVDIYTDDNYYRGCETCDYGSTYEREVKFYFNDGKYFVVEGGQSYDYPMTLADIMYVVLNYHDHIKTLDRDAFCEFIYKALIKKTCCNLDYNTNIKLKQETYDSMEDFDVESPFEFEV